MNRKQKTCLLIGIALVVVMGLYPPWVVEIKMGSGDHVRTFVYRALYAWIGNPSYTAKTKLNLYRAYYETDRTMSPSQVKVIGISWACLVIQFLIVAYFTFIFSVYEHSEYSFPEILKKD